MEHHDFCIICEEKINVDSVLTNHIVYLRYGSKDSVSCHPECFIEAAGERYAKYLGLRNKEEITISEEFVSSYDPGIGSDKTKFSKAKIVTLGPGQFRVEFCDV